MQATLVVSPLGVCSLFGCLCVHVFVCVCVWLFVRVRFVCVFVWLLQVLVDGSQLP